MNKNQLQIYRRFDEEFMLLLEQNGLELMDALRLTKLGKALIQSRKKSISSMQRHYFEHFTVKDTIQSLQKLYPCFHSINRAILYRVISLLSKHTAYFLVTDDYLIPRYTKTAYRSDRFRDPVKRKIGIGHNIVDTIITTRKLELTFAFAIQPKHSKIPKTKRGLKQLLHARCHRDFHACFKTYKEKISYNELFLQ